MEKFSILRGDSIIESPLFFYIDFILILCYYSSTDFE